MKPWKRTDEQLRDALESHRGDLDVWQVTFLDGISEAIASRIAARILASSFEGSGGPPRAPR